MSVFIIDFTFGDRSLVTLDSRISDDIAESLSLIDGKLELTPTEDFVELAAAAPELWFVAKAGDVDTLRFGEPPDELAALVGYLGALDVKQLDDDGFQYLDALVKIEETPFGDISVLFGGGPMMGPFTHFLRFTFGNALPALLVVSFVLCLTNFVVIPRLIGNAMTGLRRAVFHAKAIDLDKLGTRLPTEEVPSEIAALVDAMNAALLRIDDGHQRHQRFLADAAHELRTPIAILQNRIELLAEGEAGDQLLLDVQRLANLAEQLLDLQRMTHRKTDLHPVDLVSLSRHVVSDLAPMAVNAGYEPLFVADADAVQVIGDRSAIERAIINIFQNAIAYGGNRGTIMVSVLRKGAIEVSDDGDGVPHPQRECIFEPFHRLKPIDRGAGLGLNLVREIMRHHDGTVSVSESRSGGARFVLQFLKEIPVT